MCIFGSVIRAKGAKSCSSDQIAVVTDVETIVMIQTDKPIYKPNDMVRYQIIAMESSTKPVKLEKIQVNVYDGKGKQVAASNIIKNRWSKHGFFEGMMQLAEEPNFGNWTLKVKINDDTVETTKMFGVDRYVLPPFKVFIESNPRVSFLEKSLTFKIFAKYSFDKFVNGKAKVTAMVYNELDPSDILSKHEKVEVVNGEVKTLTINFKNDLNMNYVLKNMILSLDVEFEEENTGIISKATREVLVFPNSKHIISLKRQQHFKPGFPYKIDVFVATVDGLPEKSTTIPLTMKLKYKYEQGVTESDKTLTEVAFLKQGKANFILQLPENINGAEVSFEYDKVKINEQIKKDISSVAGEFLQITVPNKM